MSTSKKEETPAPAPAASDKPAGEEPVASRAPVPVLFIALLVSLLYWGNMFIVENGGQLDARVHQPYRSFKEISDLQPKSEEEIIIAKGKLLYEKCAACHQADGNGSASQNAPPLAGSEWVAVKDPARIARIVLHGLSGPITVKGREWSAGQMLAWKDIYNDAEIAQILSYVRNSWGNKAPVVKPSEVAKAREETKERGGYMTAEELMKVKLKE
jgi:mono/diheme cytochrome c family protein